MHLPPSLAVLFKVAGVQWRKGSAANTAIAREMSEGRKEELKEEQISEVFRVTDSECLFFTFRYTNDDRMDSITAHDVFMTAGAADYNGR